MPSPDAQSTHMLVLAASAASALVTLGLYVWLGFALSRLFPLWGRDGWRGWVPFVNIAELLSVGGFPPWRVVLLFVPVVNLYALVILIVSVQRITTRMGRHAGLTWVGVLIPPLWATLLLRDATAPAPGPVTGSVPTPTAPTADRATPVPRPAPLAPTALSAPAAAPAAAPTPPPTSAAPPTSTTVPTSAAPPAETHDSEPDLAWRDLAWHDRTPSTSIPGSDDAEVPPPAPWASALPTLPEVSGAAPRSAPLPWAPDPAAPPATSPTTDDHDHDHDHDHDSTVVVDRRPRIRWTLVVDDAPPVALTADHVLLGRKPTASDPAVQALALQDSTRTLSKVHARLDLADGQWTITDLNSTNGVMLVAVDGTETLLDAGATASAQGRFVLGEVGMHLTFEEGR
ncbi:DUF5684 domain-containing protein [Demequina capsici]|uniref:DUF5684 domain-containing protein n=1 Tax=Demequina capsici TaxID=3075620 RepID=A0AA96J949_9MICO|nr:DUF5684 domain-containing protein [Demequina sp. PMTSA13]WNM26922.1 DUF5684 domain-containing protein [Demequina sp. PMTSA13]